MLGLACGTGGLRAVGAAKPFCRFAGCAEVDGGSVRGLLDGRRFGVRVVGSYALPRASVGAEVAAGSGFAAGRS